MKPTGAPLFLVLSLCPFAFAQSITGTVATAGVVQATFGAQTQAVPLPVGPMTPTADFLAIAGTPNTAGAVSRVGWVFGGSLAPASLLLQQSFAVNGSGPAQASFGPGDFLLTLQAPAGMAAAAALLGIEHGLQISGGVTVPVLTVDVNDDGTIEFASGSGVTATLPVMLVAAGVPVRVRTQNNLLVPSQVASNLLLTLRPANTLAHRIGLGCYFGGDMMSVEASFAGDVILYKQCTHCFTWIPVLGFGIQPVALPAPLPNCVLYPSPDVVLFFSLNHSAYGFPVPPAVRPITFWTQSVELSPLGFATGSTFQVDAQ